MYKSAMKGFFFVVVSESKLESPASMEGAARMQTIASITLLEIIAASNYVIRLLWMRLRLGQTTRSLLKSSTFIFGQECTLRISNALQRDIADSSSSSCNMVHARSWRFVSLGQSSFRTSRELQLLRFKV